MSETPKAKLKDMTDTQVDRLYEEIRGFLGDPRYPKKLQLWLTNKRLEMVDFNE